MNDLNKLKKQAKLDYNVPLYNFGSPIFKNQVEVRLRSSLTCDFIMSIFIWFMAIILMDIVNKNI